MLDIFYTSLNQNVKNVNEILNNYVLDKSVEKNEDFYILEYKINLLKTDAYSTKIYKYFKNLEIKNFYKENEFLKHILYEFKEYICENIEIHKSKLTNNKYQRNKVFELIHPDFFNFDINEGINWTFVIMKNYVDLLINNFVTTKINSKEIYVMPECYKLFPLLKIDKANKIIHVNTGISDKTIKIFKVFYNFLILKKEFIKKFNNILPVLSNDNSHFLKNKISLKLGNTDNSSDHKLKHVKNVKKQNLNIQKRTEVFIFSNILKKNTEISSTFKNLWPSNLNI